jgi:lactate dehydrogenase-like 2-hydroxyacid dehydrogenase
MLIRHLHYLSALAKERHFARAAVACHVTQPTLSAGIKQLEETIGVLIVERGQRFIGLTAEGERVLSWAQRVLADYDSLTQELGEMREGLAGRLRIGAIPVALPVVQHLTREFGRRHPQAAISVRSVSSIPWPRLFACSTTTPSTGYPTSYARDDLPKIERYPDGQTLPTPKGIDFTPGTLLGSVSGELGLRKYLESNGHTLVVTSSKDGKDSQLDKELHDAEIVISQPFWPAYMTAERIAKAPKLKMILTAGIGSDHTDLQAAMERGITVAEVTYCNSNSVAEHVVMMTLALVRNYIPSYNWIIKGGWNIADCVARSYDLEGMNVGTVAAGRIGLRVLRLLKPFDVKLHYMDRHRLPEAVEKELNLTHHETVASLAKVCDVVTLNCPLHPETENMVNAESLKGFKRGAYLINTARGKLCDPTPSPARWRAASSPAMPATSGSRSRPPPTIRGATCRTTA